METNNKNVIKNALKNKKLMIIIAAVLAVALITTLIICLACCGKKVDDLYIASTNTPRLTYVQGQELDLSKGSLTVVIDDEEILIPLDSEDVSVSGYDKDTLGEQTVTFTYDDVSTTLKVTVIPRMAPSGYEEDYFVGDSFNTAVGKLTVATDEGKTFGVDMKDSRVKLVSFDSTKAGDTAVTVSFSDGTNTYNCTFTVTIHENATVTFTPPRDDTYFSHETDGVNVAGGYFTVLSADGSFKKEVKLSADMVKNFDLSDATMANRTNALEKDIKVEYLSKEFTYKIKVFYSDVSVVKYYGNGVLSTINWAASADLNNLLTAEQSNAAFDAIKSYYKLNDNEKALISDEITNLVVRAGALTAAARFDTELEKYDGTFAIDEQSNIYLTAEDFDTVKADLAQISDPDADVNVLAELLVSLKADFPDVEIVTGKTVAKHGKVYNIERRNYLISFIEHMVNVFEPIKDIPDSWTLQTLEAYADDITNATLQINVAGYYNYTEGGAAIYTDILSPWRANNDYFDILYSYFLYVAEDINFVAKNMVGKVPLPGLLEDWYGAWSMAVVEALDFSQQREKAFLDDVTTFMYNYYEVVRLADEIKTSGNTLWNDIYEACEGDKYNRLISSYDYKINYDYGYLYHMQGFRDSENVLALWAKYCELVKLYDNYTLSAETHASEIKAMFDSFVALSPSEVYGFLSSLNFMYGVTSHNYNVLTYGVDTSYNKFARILRDFYVPTLHEEVRPLFAELLLAIENYALVGHNDGAMNKFNEKMAAIADGIDGFVAAEAASDFNSKLGAVYAKYTAIYNLANGTAEANLTANEAELLASLKTSLDRYFALHGYMGDLNKEGEQIPDALYGIIYALFAEAEAHYDAFRAAATPEALAYLYQKTYSFNDNSWTLEVALFNVDRTTTQMLDTRIFGSEESDIYYGWDLYKDHGLEQVFAKLAPMLYYGYAPENITFTASDITEFTNCVGTLSEWQYQIFTLLDVADAYYEAIGEYFESAALSENAKTVAAKLLDAEKKYRNKNTTGFEAVMTEIESVYASLSAAEKAYLDDMYVRYYNLHNS